LSKLGYSVRLEGEGAKRRAITTAPAGRRAFFVGDFIDRGPNSPDVLRIAMAMDARGQALAVIGNHDDKLLRFMKGRKVTLSHGLDGTVEQLKPQGEAFRAEVEAYLATLPIHAWLDGGRLVVVHAGIKTEMLGRNYSAARAFCLYGDTSGKLDAAGLPERFNWGADYRGEAAVIYGHTPVAELEWINNTLCIDTGCVFGGTLTALRWPERELVSVPALKTYAELRRGFGLPPPRPQA
jgi:protein phosphatase